MLALGSGDAEELYLEYQGRAARDAGLVGFAVGLLGGDVYFPFVSHMHLLQGYHPTGYQISQPESRRHSPTASQMSCH